MKKKTISLFDLGLLLLVLIFGAGAYWLVHGEPDSPPDSADPLVEDICRNSRRYTDPSALTETEHYVLQYQTALDTGNLDRVAALTAPGTQLLNHYNGQPMGTLEDMELMTLDGRQRVVLTMSCYAICSKVLATTPSGSYIRAGDSVYLDSDGETLGLATILWISH